MSESDPLAYLSYPLGELRVAGNPSSYAWRAAVWQHLEFFFEWRSRTGVDFRMDFGHSWILNPREAVCPDCSNPAQRSIASASAPYLGMSLGYAFGL